MKQNKKLIKEIPTLSGKDADRFAKKMLDIENQSQKETAVHVSPSDKIKIPKGGYTKRDKLVRRETIEEVEKIIKKYRQDGIGFDYYGFIEELKQLKNMRDDDGKKEM